MLEHGGKLRAAAARYEIPLEKWIDLSTGINPNGWQGEMPPLASWSQLPQDDDGLVVAAHHYYGASHVLPVAGSQAAIQALPRLRAQSSVAVLAPSYNEHAHAWQRTGHRVELIAAAQLGDAVASNDVVVVVHPNNPTGAQFSQELLMQWHEQLAVRGGWLVVDEAFIDTTPEQSLAACTGRRGLIVLRSLGKFFGLAGARVGFVLADALLAKKLQEALGPWTISGPARWLATQALNDTEWQAITRIQLKQQGQRLNRLLTQYGLLPDGGTSLFQSVVTEQAEVMYVQLARQGILTRLFSDHPRIRFGLPGNEAQWQRLQQALAESISPYQQEKTA